MRAKQTADGSAGDILKRGNERKGLRQVAAVHMFASFERAPDVARAAGGGGVPASPAGRPGAAADDNAGGGVVLPHPSRDDEKRFDDEAQRLPGPHEALNPTQKDILLMCVRARTQSAPRARAQCSRRGLSLCSTIDHVTLSLLARALAQVSHRTGAAPFFLGARTHDATRQPRTPRGLLSDYRGLSWIIVFIVGLS